MSIVVSCRCGQQFKTDERHAGKRVPCPACGSRLTIPAAANPPPPPPAFKHPVVKQGVRVQCPCGWAFLAPPSCQGKSVLCPGCNGQLEVPHADPLGVGHLGSPLESLHGSHLHGGRGYDPTDRLVRQLAWVAGGSVALMLFGMFVTYLVFRFPAARPDAATIAVAPQQLPKRVDQPLPQQNKLPAAPTSPAPAAPPKLAAAPAAVQPADSTEVFGPPTPPEYPPSPGSPRGTGDVSIGPRLGPRGPRIGSGGPRIGPRGPRFGPPGGDASHENEGDTPPENESAEAGGPSARPNAALDPTAVRKLPDSLQAWFAQPGDKLTGLKRVGTSETPAAHFSWMTGLLPYLDQQQLYERIDFSKPVESPENLKAGSTQVSAFLNPLDDRQRWEGYPFHGMALTHFAGMSGVEDSRNVVAAKLPRSDPRAGVFGYDEVARPAQITDGLSQTIMMVGAGVLSNPWLFGGGGTIRGAREPLFDKTSGLGTKGLSGGGTMVVMADGSVRHVSANVDPSVFKAMSTIHGADSVDLERSAPPFSLDQLQPPAQTSPRASYRSR